MLSVVQSLISWGPIYRRPISGPLPWTVLCNKLETSKPTNFYVKFESYGNYTTGVFTFQNYGENSWVTRLVFLFYFQVPAQRPPSAKSIHRPARKPVPNPSLSRSPYESYAQTHGTISKSSLQALHTRIW